METTEKIVEAYVRYVKGWATIPNIKCHGQYEIDLLAINPVTNEKYHIESGVSVSQSHSKLTTNTYSEELLKERINKPKQRRTLGYFKERKFSAPEILVTLEKYGFIPGGYSQVIVTWDYTEEALSEAKWKKIEIWDFKQILFEITEKFKNERSYFIDDTLRTLQLYARASKSFGTNEI